MTLDQILSSIPRVTQGKWSLRLDPGITVPQQQLIFAYIRRKRPDIRNQEMLNSQLLFEVTPTTPTHLKGGSDDQ